MRNRNANGTYAREFGVSRTSIAETFTALARAHEGEGRFERALQMRECAREVKGVAAFLRSQSSLLKEDKKWRVPSQMLSA